MNLLKLKNIISKVSDPYIMVLIGPPLSGKDWVLDNLNISDAIVISRDQIVLDVYGSDNYDEAFSRVDQKKVNRMLASEMVNAASSGQNVIINMTNMTSKRRRHTLSYFDEEYYKIAVIFPILSEEEYIKRNKKRSFDSKKTISLDIINQMINSFQPISNNEGFDKVISL